MRAGLGEALGRTEQGRHHMGVRMNRTAIIDRGKADEAVAFAGEIAKYVQENWGVSVGWGMEVGGTFGKVHWFVDYENMAQYEESLGRTMTDEGYRKLLESAADLFVVGQSEDTLVYMM